MTESPGRRIRVLWLTKGLGPGGAERLLLSFAKRADHERFEFHAAYLLPWKDHLVAELERHGVATTCLQAPRPLDLRWVGRLRRLVRDHDIDVVHVHSPLVAAFARVGLRALPRRHRPAIIGTEHNVWSSHRTPTRWANRLTLPLEDCTLAVSDQVRGSMPPRLAARTEVVIHGVDVDEIAARRIERDDARAELGLEPDELAVVTVANLRANKDYPSMLRAARMLVDDGVNVRFLSVGQGPLERELAEMRDQLGLGDRFRFLGYREDPIRVLVAGDIFCLSSRYEGLPIALLEAMALGVPPVATAVGGIPYVLGGEDLGRLVDPGDPGGLALAISTLSDGVSLLSRSEAASTRARDFDIGSAIQWQEDQYARLGVRRSSADCGPR